MESKKCPMEIENPILIFLLNFKVVSLGILFLIIFKNFREGENMKLFAGTLKVNRILGWEPFVSLEEGIQKTIGYYYD